MYCQICSLFKNYKNALTVKKDNGANSEVEEYIWPLTGIDHCQDNGQNKYYYLKQKCPNNAACKITTTKMNKENI